MSTRLSDTFCAAGVAMADRGRQFFAALYGYYWYRPIAGTPVYLWLFTPDCPLAALIMAAALGLYLFRGKGELVSFPDLYRF